jgi:hypothetical protein
LTGRKVNLDEEFDNAAWDIKDTELPDFNSQLRRKTSERSESIGVTAREGWHPVHAILPEGRREMMFNEVE